jgi:hypothetical protein
MNDLAFGSTLLSILVTLAAAVLVEATHTTVPVRAPEPVIGNGSTPQVQVASARASNCDCDTRLFARAGAR